MAAKCMGAYYGRDTRPPKPAAPGLLGPVKRRTEPWPDIFFGRFA